MGAGVLLPGVLLLGVLLRGYCGGGYWGVAPAGGSCASCSAWALSTVIAKPQAVHCVLYRTRTGKSGMKKSVNFVTSFRTAFAADR